MNPSGVLLHPTVLGPLHPMVFSFLILLVFIPVAFLQWCVLVPLAKRSRVLRSLDGNPRLGPVTFRVPFIADGFFILWNLLPLAGGLIYGVVWYNWSFSWGSSFVERFGDGVVPIYGRWLGWLHHYNLVLILLSGLALFSCAYQVIKQRWFIKSGVKAYWWDWRISRSIYVIRLICLFVNMIAILFYATALLTLFAFVTETVSVCEPRPVLLHSDGMAGFGDVGSLCFWLTIAFLVISGTSFAGIFDHWHHGGLVHRVSDVGSFAITLALAMWILIFPAAQIHRKLSEPYSRIQSMTSALADKSLSDLKRIIDSGDQRHLNEYLERNAGKMLVQRDLLATKTFPIETSDIMALFSTFGLPFLIWLFFYFLDQFAVTERPAPRSPTV